MFYEFQCNVTLASTRDNPDIFPIYLVRGVITHVAIRFEATAGGSYIVIKRALHQVWPTNPDGYFFGHDETIEWDEQYEMNAEPFALEIVGWNDLASETDMLLRVRFSVLGGADAAAAQAAINALRYLNLWFNRRPPVIQ